MRRAVLILMAISLMMAGGCAKPCDELADRACERAGDGSETCAKIRDKAKKANSEDQRACRKGLEMVETLSKNR